MPSSYTTSLRLTLPATGELAGQWGNTVNTGITELLDAAVAGTTTISTWGGAGVAYTLSNNSGTADEARRMFIVATGSPGEAKNVICPAVSKFYVFRNDTTGGFALTLKTFSGTGVSVPAGQYKFLYCDGTNVVEMFNSAGALTLSGALTVNGTTTLASNPTLSAGTANQVQFLNASKVLTGSANLTFDGTSLTLGGNPTLSGGTANGVLYLNGSKVATSGSALTFDGTGLGVGAAPSAARVYARTAAATGTAFQSDNSVNTGFVVRFEPNTTLFGNDFNQPLAFLQNNAEQMRLTSTGLGIGTSSPLVKLDVKGTTNTHVGITASGVDEAIILAFNDGGIRTPNLSYAAASHKFLIDTTERMRLDSSGNLGLGVTPSAWSTAASRKAIQLGYIGGAAVFTNATGNTLSSFVHNAYDNGTNWLYAASSVGAARYEMTGANAGSTHAWYVSAGGTAGNAISFTQAMTLDASGNLGVGTSVTGAARVIVEGTSAAPGVFDALLLRNASDGGVGLYFDNSVSANLASIEALVASTGVGTDDGILAFSTATNGVNTERARITSGGDLLVGNTAALGGLTREVLVNTASGSAGINFAVAASLTARIRSESASTEIGTVNSAPLIFNTANTERARITSGGDLLVGTTTASGYHRLNRSNTSDWVVAFTNASATTPWGVVLNYSAAAPNNTSPAISFSDTGGERATIRNNGGLANYSGNNVNLSDRREKTNFAPAKSYLDTICAIPVQTFEYIDQSPDDPGLTLGVVAQDVQAVAPELVMESNWGTEDNPKMRLSIYQTDLQYALMKCVQELKAELDATKARLAALEAQP